MTLTQQDYRTLTFAMEIYMEILESENIQIPRRLYEVLWAVSDLSDKVLP